MLASLRRIARRAPVAIAKRPLLWGAALLVGALFPVRLSVLAPAELVPANPVAVRAPLEGVIKTFFVRSNDPVKAGQPLFAYDDVAFASKLEVAAESLRTAEAEQRQLAQLALVDAKARGALAAAKGAVEEKRLELEFLRGQLERNRVTAPHDGIVFIDDVNEWIGRPVIAGQRILRLAEPQDQEIEAWLPVADAIELPANGRVRLYLSASPLAPVSGRIRTIAYEATRRPDGSFAYRVRAALEGPSDHRVGLKGTARLSGGRVPLIYWVLRRPLASARTYLGI
jgi:multidrug efflux pump subunit AcrA (membrane-fusion protein)